MLVDRLALQRGVRIAKQRHEALAVERIVGRACRAAAISSNVGNRSTWIAGTSQIEPGWVTPGQRTMNGTRVPPSYRLPLPLRSGALSVMSPASCDALALVAADAAVVAGEDQRPCSRRASSSSSVAMTRPTLSSTLAIIAA